VPAAIRSLYNDFVSCYYPSVNTFTEEYHQWGSPGGPFYKVPDEAKFVNRLRDLLVREEGDTLWILAGIPRRWLSPGERISVNKAPTYFGPASLNVRASKSGVEARVELPRRNPINTAWMVVRAPGGKRMRTVEIDGQPWKDFDPKAERIRLPLKETPIQVSVRF